VIDPHDQWLLELVVEGRHGLDVLGRDPGSLAELLNRPGHGLAPDEVSDRVVRLIDRGWLELIANHARIELPASELRAIVARRQRTDWTRDRVYFGLTASGAATWEGLARPDWTRCLVAEGDEQGWSFTAMQRSRVEELLRSWYGDPAATPGATWRVLAPWQATYWKLLPSATCCTMPGELDAQLRPEPAELRRWFEPVRLPG
jgi:hypothetical protein